MKEVIVALITSSIWRRFHVAIFFLQGMDSLFIIINKIFGTRRTKYPSTTPTMVSSYEKRKVRLALKTAVSFLVCLPPGKIIDTVLFNNHALQFFICSFVAEKKKTTVVYGVRSGYFLIVRPLLTINPENSSTFSFLFFSSVSCFDAHYPDSMILRYFTGPYRRFPSPEI